MNKHEAVWNWLCDCPEIADMYFNFSQSNNGDTAIIPMTAYNDMWKYEPFIDDSGEKIYTFTIVQFERYSTTPNNTENIDILLDVEKVANWIDKQHKIENYPLFPSNSQIFKIKALPFENGGIAGQDENGAKYMFSVQIEYLYTNN